MLKTTRTVAAMARSMPGRSLRHLGGWWGNRGMERGGNLFKNSTIFFSFQSFSQCILFFVAQNQWHKRKKMYLMDWKLVRIKDCKEQVTCRRSWKVGIIPLHVRVKTYCKEQNVLKMIAILKCDEPTCKFSYSQLYTLIIYRTNVHLSSFVFTLFRIKA